MIFLSQHTLQVFISEHNVGKFKSIIILCIYASVNPIYKKKFDKYDDATGFIDVYELYQRQQGRVNEAQNGLH